MRVRKGSYSGGNYAIRIKRSARNGTLARSLRTRNNARMSVNGKNPQYPVLADCRQNSLFVYSIFASQLVVIGTVKGAAILRSTAKKTSFPCRPWKWIR